MADAMRILCVHGVNTAEANPEWQQEWTEIIQRRLHSFQPRLQVDAPQFVHYNDIFKKYDFGPIDEMQAFFKLTASGVWHGIGDWFAGRRGLGDVPHALRWTAGMVVQWAENMKLREETRARLAEDFRTYQPHLVLAHSLGSLVLYDTLRRDRRLAADRMLLTFGSQIGNPFVRQELGGRIESLGQKFWWHLFNPNDKVLTHQISLANEPFEQVVVDLDAGFLGHDAGKYLDNDLTAAHVWEPVATGGIGRDMARSARRGLVLRKRKEPRHRALLVGINEYPDPGMQLEGCVNDTFLMSGALQDVGVPASGIRVLLDRRATTDAIWERLAWLLDDPQPGDQRVFFYSGHGAQVPNYGPEDEVDHVDECLVPYDFDWSPQHSILDDRFFDMYAQLPYDTLFTAILDCCHSGGMTRGSVRVRGIDPPADIRHRALQWGGVDAGWVSRSFGGGYPQLGTAKEQVAYTGVNNATRRFGRALGLRALESRKYDRLLEQYGHRGPYMPVLLEACSEHESAYEHRDGATPYGAFTYSLVRALRSPRKRRPSYRQLMKEAARGIGLMHYDQHPQPVGPAVRLNRSIPWGGGKSR